MKFSLDSGSGSYAITACGADGVRVNGVLHTVGLVVMPDLLVEAWPPPSVAALTAEHLIELLDGQQPDVLLLGSGARQCFPERTVLRACAERGVGIEVMDTAAACRTYAVLMAEGRRVMAALIVDWTDGEAQP